MADATPAPSRAEDQTVKLHARTRTTLAWSLWLATFGCCAAGLAVTLALIRPLTLGVLAEGAAFTLAFALGFATVGLVLTLRLPANPIGWLYAAAGVVLRCGDRGDAEAATSAVDQIAKASSSNATATRRPAGSPTASS
jgi:hypothetical protein